MRIGVDGREAVRAEPRGIGLYCLRLAEEFGRQAPEHEFLYYHERDLPDTPPELPDNVRPVQVSIRGHRLHTWERVAIPWRIKKDRCHLYHGTYNTIPPRWKALRLPPMMVTIHDVIVTWIDEGLDDPYVRYVRAVTQRVLKDAARVLTPSNFSKQDVCTRFDADPDKIQVIPNGLHPEYLEPADPELVAWVREHHADGRPYVFVLGASLERKNTRAAVEAFGRVLAKGGDLPHKLVINGLNPEAKARIQQAAEQAGVADRLVTLPYLTRPELVAVYAGADLAVYPTLAEGWGFPVLEALSQGTPIATANTTSLPEAGGDHAFYFDPYEVESMAAVIGDALWKPERFAAIREAAVERARGFTWARHVETYLAQLNGLAADAGR